METPQNKGNAIIAKIRAQGIIQSIKKALQKSQAKVVGLENIEYTSSQTHLTNEEFGELSQAALRAYGNGANRAMQLVVAYNTKKLPENVDVAMLKRIIDAKRKGDVMLVVTTKGTKQTVDISNWSYVLLLALF